MQHVRGICSEVKIGRPLCPDDILEFGNIIEIFFPPFFWSFSTQFEKNSMFLISD